MPVGEQAAAKYRKWGNGEKKQVGHILSDSKPLEAEARSRRAEQQRWKSGETTGREEKKCTRATAHTSTATFMSFQIADRVYKLQLSGVSCTSEIPRLPFIQRRVSNRPPRLEAFQRSDESHVKPVHLCLSRSCRERFTRRVVAAATARARRSPDYR